MQLKVSPTRMELLRLRKRIELAQRGHKLLQDKLEGLIKEFMPLVSEYVKMRRELDSYLSELFARFGRVAAELGEEPFMTALGATGMTTRIELSEERRANVPVPVASYRIERSGPHYSLSTTPRELDLATAQLEKALALMLKTAEREETLRRLAAEIERTRRRVNALEYILIPRLFQTRKFIQAKLDEDERAARIRSMKVKEILERASRR